MSVHACAGVTLNSQILALLGSAWNKRFASRSAVRPQSSSADRQLQQSFDAAVRSVSELVHYGLVDPLVVRHVSTGEALHPLSRGLISHSSSWSFEQNKRIGDRLFARTRNPSAYLLVRTFRTRTGASVGIGSDRESLIAASASRRETELPDEKVGEHSGEKVVKRTTAKLDGITRGSLSVDEEGLTQQERDRIRVAFADGYLAAAKKPEKGSKWKLFSTFKDTVAFILMIIILLGILDSSAGSPFRRALIGGPHEVHPEEIDVTFDDVKGVAEAKQELQEVVEFLKNPERISQLGAKLPKGVLLVGPPGTGKTLLARAVAGEAGVPFFHASGPEFDEVFVGQGARRVRDLFSQAKLRAPCVIFIDEIDSVGQKRTNSAIHPYANQTVNQLLTEMDGFNQNEGVIVIGATNRREELDRALLRPGRFDEIVTVSLPDLKGREELFDYYLSKIKKSSDVSVTLLARNTTGFTGADIENMINQAALRAAIDGCSVVTMAHMEYSRDKVIMGPARKSRIPDEEVNRNTAVHEAGHTLVCFYTRDATPLHKVTIISRGASLGHTAFIPDKENYSLTKSQMLAQLDVAMGGRVAEELMFGSEKVTSGASNDLKGATEVATNMVKFMGMSEKVGVRTFHNTPDARDISTSSSEAVDSEIKRLLQESYERAKNLLKNHQNELKLLAEALLKYETLDAEDVKRVIEGKEPRVASGHRKHLLDLSTGHERLPRIPPPKGHSPHPFKF